MPVKRGVASTSTAGKGMKGGWIGASADRSDSEKPIELLIEREFREPRGPLLTRSLPNCCSGG